MTQSMPPAQLLSGSLKGAPNAPTRTESGGDFASAFRDQLDSQVDTSAHRSPLTAAAEPDAALAAAPFAASSGPAIATANVVSEAIASSAQGGSPGEADPSLLSGDIVEPVDRVQVLVGTDSVNDLQNFAVPAADTTRSPALDLAAGAATGSAAVAAVSPPMAPIPADSQNALRWSEPEHSREALQGVGASGVGSALPATAMPVEGTIRNIAPDLRTAEQNVSLPKNVARSDETPVSAAASSARTAASEFVVNTAAVQDGLLTASQSSMPGADTSRAIAIALAAVSPSASAPLLDAPAALATAAAAVTSKAHPLHTPAAVAVPIPAATATVAAEVAVTGVAAIAALTSQAHATAPTTAPAVTSQEPATAAVAATAEVSAVVGTAAATADTKISVTAPPATAVATAVPVSRTPNRAADFRIGTRLSQVNVNQRQTPVGKTDSPAVANSSAPNVAVTQDGSLSMDVSARDFARLDGAATVTASQPVPTLAPLSAALPVASAPNAQQLSSTAPIQLNVDTPLTDPGWGSVVGARLAWGAAQGIQTATIVLNPRELGPVNVTLSMMDDEATVSFVSQQALVRDAIEAALPRLRELFSGEGISLGDVDISNGDGRSSGGGDTASRRDTPAHPRSGELAESASHEERGRVLDSLVDTFA